MNDKPLDMTYRTQIAALHRIGIIKDVRTAVILLEENLAKERRFGSTETLRNERASIIDLINQTLNIDFLYLE